MVVQSSKSKKSMSMIGHLAFQEISGVDNGINGTKAAIGDHTFTVNGQSGTEIQCKRAHTHTRSS